MTYAADPNLEAEIARLGDLDLGQLREVWRQRLGKPPKIASTELTRRWLSWELQARVRGSIDPTTRARLKQLSKADRAGPAPAIPSCAALRPGTVLTREWNDATHRVMVLEEGFTWNGQQFASLSEVALRITGTRWSGPRFFGLRQRSKS